MTESMTAPGVTADAVTVGAGEFRALMSGFPTGVSIVTTRDLDDRPWGMTCSAICSVSVDPPTLLVCLRRESPTLAALLRRATFTVNLVHEHGRPAAELFASGAADRFDRVRWTAEPGAGGPHLVDDAHAIADCAVTRHEVVGDHSVVFGQVFRLSPQAPVPPRPLLYGRRQFASWPG
ncbi:flavin reductase family protein [Amycolatopsis sp. 195334CR]|uniref:flavin reductase family protein n=1 Tax=Amycolatopsis sp. 195334CR TaxID=2814588 RepID=UPI001F5D493C|nr:flavin reductase family protein [Amycolatopsis sp. 195334CR]